MKAHYRYCVGRRQRINIQKIYQLLCCEDSINFNAKCQCELKKLTVNDDIFVFRVKSTFLFESLIFELSQHQTLRLSTITENSILLLEK